MDYMELGKIVKNCSIVIDHDSIGVYELGMIGTFESHYFFLDSKEVNICEFCKDRNKNILNNCSPLIYCNGFSHLKNNNCFLDLDSLFIFLKDKNYFSLDSENNDNNYLFLNNDKRFKRISVHLIKKTNNLN